MDFRTALPAESWESRTGVRESFVDRDEDPASLPGGYSYGPLVSTLRTFLDAFAGALPDRASAQELAGDLERWTVRMREHGVSERHQAFGHRVDLPGRGQVMAPTFVATGKTPDEVTGTVTFGRYFLGGHGAVHGGAVALLFDEVMGRLSDTSGRPPARTANLRVDYRAPALVDTELSVRAWFEREEGRKRHLRGEICHGRVVCAEAEALFVALLDGQG